MLNRNKCFTVISDELSKQTLIPLDSSLDFKLLSLSAIQGSYNAVHTTVFAPVSRSKSMKTESVINDIPLNIICTF